jgi:hypothetical protein
VEAHTEQWQPSEGTPIDVPEPRTVTLIGSTGIVQSDRAAGGQSFKGSAWPAYERDFALA